jgi:hypothetical protein
MCACVIGAKAALSGPGAISREIVLSAGIARVADIHLNSAF